MAGFIDTTSSQLIKGDCLSILKQLPDSSIDCVITDPPYNLGLFMHNRNTNLKKMRDNQFAFAGWDDLSFEEWQNNMNLCLSEFSRILKKRGNLIIFMAVIKVGDIIKIANEHKFYYKTTGTWHKTNPMPRNMNIHFVNSTESWLYFVNKGTSGTFNNNGKVIHDFIESSVCPPSEKKFGKHPTQKPIAVMEHFVKTLSNPGDIILDPFMGSGSTCVAAANNNRRYLGIELNEEYFKIANKRLGL